MLHRHSVSETDQARSPASGLLPRLNTAATGAPMSFADDRSQDYPMTLPRPRCRLVDAGKSIECHAYNSQPGRSLSGLSHWRNDRMFPADRDQRLVGRSWFCLVDIQGGFRYLEDATFKIRQPPPEKVGVLFMRRLWRNGPQCLHGAIGCFHRF